MLIRLRDARFNHLIHHRLVRPGPWSNTRILASPTLSKRSIGQLQETGFGESINPSLGAILLFSGVPLLLILPLLLLICPASLPLGLLIAFIPSGC